MSEISRVRVDGMTIKLDPGDYMRMMIFKVSLKKVREYLQKLDGPDKEVYKLDHEKAALMLHHLYGKMPDDLHVNWMKPEAWSVMVSIVATSKDFEPLPNETSPIPEFQGTPR